MARIAEVRFIDCERVIRCAFPGAKSRRTVKVEERKSYHVSDYWDGGSRNECRFIDLKTMNVISAQEVPALTEGNLYSLANGNVELSPGFIVVEHCIFCGKDLGYRVYVSPEGTTALAEKDGFRSLQGTPIVKQLTSTSVEGGS